MSNPDTNALVAARVCPIFGKEIDCELCYEATQVGDGILKIDSVPELSDLNINAEKVKEQCSRCKYSSMWEDDF